MTSPADLALCCSTLTADPFGVDGAEVDCWLDAAAGHGFGGLSLWTLHVMAAAPDGDLAGLRRRIHDRGLTVDVVEAVTAWATASGVSADADTDLALDTAQALGADQIIAVTMEAELADPDGAVEGFARLCDRAAARGVRVALEFLPWSAIPTLAAAWDLVERAGRPNGGVMIDTWHWQRQPGGPSTDVLATMPGGAIQVVQLCDAAPVAGDDLLAEAMTARGLPGDGVVDFAGLADGLAAIGAEPILAPEVFNHALAAEGVDRFAGRQARACAAVWSSAAR